MAVALFAELVDEAMAQEAAQQGKLTEVRKAYRNMTHKRPVTDAAFRKRGERVLLIFQALRRARALAEENGR